MNTIDDEVSAQGGEQMTTQEMLVNASSVMNEEVQAWICSVLEAIKADNAPLMGRLLKKEERVDIFGELIEFRTSSQPVAEPMNFLQFALVAQSHQCVEFLSMHWHDADLYWEAEQAVLPFLIGYEVNPTQRFNQVFEKSMAAMARGLFRSQVHMEDYGVAPFAMEYPLATRAISRILAEQTPKPSASSKPYQKRAFLLRRAAACIADGNVAGLDEWLSALQVMPAASVNTVDFMESSLLLMSCVSMKRLECSGPIFKHLESMRSPEVATGFLGHFLRQLSAELTSNGVSLGSGEEGILAEGLAMLLLSLVGCSWSYADVSASATEGLLTIVGPASAVMKQIALRVQSHAEWAAMDEAMPIGISARKSAVTL